MTEKSRVKTKKIYLQILKILRIKYKKQNINLLKNKKSIQVYAKKIYINGSLILKNIYPI